jgi:diguanylate cyclase (GGDEF)-like protein
MLSAFVVIFSCSVLNILLGWTVIWASRHFAVMRKELAKLQKLESDYAELNHRFSAIVLHDPVTNLISRQVLEEKLQQTINQSKRHDMIFAVLFINIDEFDVIKGALGYDAGNLLLKEVAIRLQSCIRQVDTLSRFTGDGFALILPQLAKSEMVAYAAQRFLDVMSQPFLIDSQELFITISMGISIYPVDGSEVNWLLKNADAALLQAKARGHNIYQFYREEMQVMSRRELVLNTSLRSDSIYQEFTLYYQPQLDVDQRKIVCMEALLRWQHPELGLITPGEFLRLAENSGRIIAIGEWVLRAACQQLNKWKDIGFTPNVAVNISMRQLENPHFTYKVSQILQETNVHPECLVFEVAEGLLPSKLDLIEKSLHMLKHLGVQIAIDDFGTGNLSLQHLRRFPIDCLKIDGSLIQDITTNQESQAIVRMINLLADSLHLDVVIEGVEYPKQKQLLMELGCYTMQGHLFCRAMLPQEFTKMLVQEINESI